MHMKKSILICLGMVFLSLAGLGQQISSSVIASGGGISKGPGIILEWTLGELSTESLSVRDKLYTQGFHQPILLAKKIMPKANPSSGYLISVAPNPVQSLLSVTISKNEKGELTVTIGDFSGRRFESKSVKSEEEKVDFDMSARIAGMYLLEVRKSNGELVESFKIIKGR